MHFVSRSFDKLVEEKVVAHLSILQNQLTYAAVARLSQ